MTKTVPLSLAPHSRLSLITDGCVAGDRGYRARLGKDRLTAANYSRVHLLVSPGFTSWEARDAGVQGRDRKS